jgi:lambda repressor-like predicted transcriptional regulator
MQGAGLFEASQRHDWALTDLVTAAKLDGENIRALARIAEIHAGSLRSKRI